MRNLGKLLSVVAVGASLVVVSSSAMAQQVDPPGGEVTAGVSLAPTDRVIVKMRSDEAPDTAALGRASGQTVTLLRETGAGAHVVQLPAAQSDAALLATMNAMARTSGVAWVEPDVRMFVSQDRSGEQWDLRSADAAPYGIDLAGTSETGDGQVVAVVDTGYLDHVDLDGRMLSGYDFISDARIGNDGDGRDTDASDPGDWITTSESRRGFFRRCPVDDSSWHGTHVSGTIAALANNDEGIDGIAPGARILPVRALGKCGGFTSDIADGVRWAAGLPVEGVDVAPEAVAGVVNLSLGGGGACSATWQEAIDAVTAVGTVVVVSAGNSSADAAGYSPASCDGVITVAATGKNGDRSFYSNDGSTVEIAAPGGDSRADDGDTILSTVNAGTTDPVAAEDGGDIYAKYQGTSMAAPHVAGVAALVLATNPDLTPADVLAVLQQSATRFPDGSSCSTGCGSGIVNAGAAVAEALGFDPTATTEPPTTPAPPTTEAPSGDAPGEFSTLEPKAGKKTVDLSWTSSTGADAYWVCIDTVEDGACTDFSNGPYAGTGVKFVGLQSGTVHEWQVMAQNAVGSVEAVSGVGTFSTR